jgi:hypothetical protein
LSQFRWLLTHNDSRSLYRQYNRMKARRGSRRQMHQKLTWTTGWIRSRTNTIRLLPTLFSTIQLALIRESASRWPSPRMR